MVQRISPENYFTKTKPSSAYRGSPEVKYVSILTQYYQTNQILQTDFERGIYFGAVLIIIGVLIGAALVYFSRR